MTPGEQLRQDHAILRAKLQMLENAVRTGPDACFAIRELVYSISRRLAEHERREEQELDPQLHAHPDKARDAFAHALACEHARHQALMHRLHELTLHGMRMPMQEVEQVITRLVTTLCAHMDREEHLLFPVLDAQTEDTPASRVQHFSMHEA